MSESKYHEQVNECLRPKLFCLLENTGLEGDLALAFAKGAALDIADALAPLVAQMLADARAEALREAADDLDRFACETYGEDIFRRPTAEDYAEVNALLKRERGHQLDGIAADAMSRAIEVQAARLRVQADYLATQEPT